MAIGDFNEKNGTLNTTSYTSPTNTGVSSRASIGPSVSINGEISGEEDILIEGSVEGLINLKKNVVTVAASGKVKAAIYGMVIHVEGEVTGDLFGTERIVVHKSGKVTGNITSPRISLEDGARLKGSISTEGTGAETSTNRSSNYTRVEELLTDSAANNKKSGFVKPKDAPSASATSTASTTTA